MRLFPNRVEKEPDSFTWALWRWFDIPGPDGCGLYLRRLTILRCPWFQVLLHWIYLPDPDRGVHNHPWAFVTIPLRGPYVEEVGVPREGGGWIERPYLNLVRWFGWKGLRHAHRIVQIIDPRARIRLADQRIFDTRPCITLVLTGRKARSWGFFDRDGQYVHWREYLGLD